MLYRFTSRIAHRVWLPRGKLSASVAGRRGAAQRWTQWASRHRTDEPAIWVHAASVGEFSTAEPVAARLRTAARVGQIVCSFSSSSMAEWPAHAWADAVDYIPLDEPRPIMQALGAIRPSLVIFSRGDLWPEFVHGAKRLGIPLAVIGGTRRRSSRHHWLPRASAVRSVFAKLDWVGAISSADGKRWERAGVPKSLIQITGDPRHDQIIERPMQRGCVRDLATWAASSRLLVAGSTSQEDEHLIAQAFQRMLSDYTDVRLMIVPHERDPKRVRWLVRELREHDLRSQAWDIEPPHPATRCVIVTKLGVLADLYALGDIAYVGGGFQRGGLHAVVEPAAYAIPVIVGPRYRDSTDAERMVNANGAVAVDSRKPVESLVRYWKGWLDDAEGRWNCGLNARKTLQEGAAHKTVQALLRLVPELGKNIDCRF